MSYINDLSVFSKNTANLSGLSCNCNGMNDIKEMGAWAGLWSTLKAAWGKKRNSPFDTPAKTQNQWGGTER